MKETPPLTEPVQQAVSELQGVLAQRFPTASFHVRRGIDDPEQTFLVTTVDIEEPDEVMDVVLERLLELKLEHGIPVNVVPVHTAARIAETQQKIAAPWSRKMPTLPPLPFR